MSIEQDIKKKLEEISTGFEDYKKSNDERILQIEKKGDADPLTDQKAERESEAITKLTDEVEALKKKLNRPSMGGEGGDQSEDAIERKSVLEAFVRDGDETSFQKYNQKHKLAQKAAGTTTSNGWEHGILEDVNTQIEERLRKESNVRDLVTTETRGSTDITDLLDMGGTGAKWRGEGGDVENTGVPQLVPVNYLGGMIYALPSSTEESFDDLAWDVENWLVNNSVGDFIEEENSVILRGDGINKPRGILQHNFTEEADADRALGDFQLFKSGVATGIGTSVDVLIDLQAELHGRYLPNARWTMHRKTLAQIRKLKDADGNYIYQPAMTDGTPEQLLGDQIVKLDDMPLIAANSKPIGYGDWKKAYKLFPIVGLRIQRDDTSKKGFVLFYVRRRLFGGAYDTRALKFLQCSE